MKEPRWIGSAWRCPTGEVKEPRWIPGSAIRAIHAELIAEHGGVPGVRDENLLESALARPRQRWAYRKTSMAELAAAYGFGLARNHLFRDGNKRMALAAISVFLDLNGYELVASEAEAVAAIRDFAAGRLSAQALARWVELNPRRARR